MALVNYAVTSSDFENLPITVIFVWTYALGGGGIPTLHVWLKLYGSEISQASSDWAYTVDGFIFVGTNFHELKKNNTFVWFKIRGHSIFFHNSYRKIPFCGYKNLWIGSSMKTTKTGTPRNLSHPQYLVCETNCFFFPIHIRSITLTFLLTTLVSSVYANYIGRTCAVVKHVKGMGPNDRKQSEKIAWNSVFWHAKYILWTY